MCGSTRKHTHSFKKSLKQKRDNNQNGLAIKTFQSIERDNRLPEISALSQGELFRKFVLRSLEVEEYFKNIDKQFAINRGKNIFFDDFTSTFIFGEDTIKAITNINELDEHYDVVIEYLTDKAIEEFCRSNQYYSFNSESKRELRNIYNDLFNRIKAKNKSLDEIRRTHYENLKDWLVKYNSFASRIYSKVNKDALEVICSEYSADLQLDILGIDTNLLMEPVLDIGCGKEGTLVKHLYNLGFESIGFDRFKFVEKNLLTCDWLEFDYGMNKWGTIISHLGFSNHFKHHHMRVDGNYILYAQTYMNIIKSLRNGGKFYYVPDLPFIEVYLDKDQFMIEHKEVQKVDSKVTVITRIK